MRRMNVYQQALNRDKMGDWNGAHDLIQDLPDPMAVAIHGYLHWKEGDEFNARYWYNRAGRQLPNNSLEEEWKVLMDEAEGY